MTNTIEFSDVHFNYGSRVALRGIDLAVPRGALFGLIGPNGAGKSTSLNILTTLLRPSAGTVSVCGCDVVEAADDARRKLGYAPEEPLIYSGLTAREFVELSAVLHGMSDADGRTEAGRLLEQFGLADRADEPVSSYSKGMRRKALLAAALVHDPDVLVLDEPLDGLDVVAQGVLKDALRLRAERGGTVVYSTHILEVIDGLCTHVGVLRDGRMLAYGQVADVRRELGVHSFEQVFRAASEAQA